MEREWTPPQLRSHLLPKKYLIKTFQDNAAHSFLNDHRLVVNIKNVAKTSKNGQLVDAVMSCCQQRSTQINAKER
ncbi:peptidyl-prolyl cis-trans isomerase FKBP3-like [Stigmatopora argus]